ncbi:MAG: Rqc2 family fibronectin-binding protein, partial [Microcoleaceae cyanobacterium]
MQPVDYTTLIAICRELQTTSLPARLEQVYQRDRFTIALALRTLQGRNWLDISWHPQLARICMGDPPPRHPDTFTFSQQLRHQLGGLALVAIAPIASWERVLDLQFAKRPGEEALWHLYVEIMGKYSNVILTTADQQIVTCGHQVNSRQSSVRTINTGQAYELPPSLTNSTPLLSESLENWQARLSLIPGAILTNLLKNYRGISKNLVLLMLEHCQIDPQATTEQLTKQDWQNLFSYWQIWLTSLETNNFAAQLTNTGYTVINWQPDQQLSDINQSVQPLINDYYTQWQNQQDFNQLRQSIKQKLNSILSKLRVKANTFQAKLQESDNCDLWRSQADLLMANLHEWQVGMQSIQLADF